MGNLRKIKRACQSLRPLPAPPADGGSQRMELDRSELEAILERAKTTPMSEAEYAKLHAVVETLVFLTQELEKKHVSIQRLKQLLFGGVLSAGLHEKVLLRGYRQRLSASLMGSAARGRGRPGEPAKPTLWRTADECQSPRECPNTPFPRTTPARSMAQPAVRS